MKKTFIVAIESDHDAGAQLAQLLDEEVRTEYIKGYEIGEASEATEPSIEDRIAEMKAIDAEDGTNCTEAEYLEAATEEYEANHDDYITFLRPIKKLYENNQNNITA